MINIKKQYPVILVFLASLVFFLNCFATDISRTGQISSTAKSVLTGKACRTQYFLLASVGDSSIAEAKRNGNIKKIATTEYTNEFLIPFFYLGINKGCTVVTGE